MVDYRTSFLACLMVAALGMSACPAFAEQTSKDASNTVEAVKDDTAQASQAAANARAAGAVSPDELAAIKADRRAQQRKAIGSRGTSNKFGSLEGLDGDELVCRVETKTGSRLKKQACYRVADIRAYRKRLEEMGGLPGDGSQSKQVDGRTGVQF